MLFLDGWPDENPWSKTIKAVTSVQHIDFITNTGVLCMFPSPVFEVNLFTAAVQSNGMTSRTVGHLS